MILSLGGTMTPLRSAHKHTGGRPKDKRSARYQAKYGLSDKQIKLRRIVFDQADACTTEAARRLILGVSRKKA